MPPIALVGNDTSIGTTRLPVPAVAEDLIRLHGDVFEDAGERAEHDLSQLFPPH